MTLFAPEPELGQLLSGWSANFSRPVLHKCGIDSENEQRDQQEEHNPPDGLGGLHYGGIDLWLEEP